MQRRSRWAVGAGGFRTIGQGSGEGGGRLLKTQARGRLYLRGSSLRRLQRFEVLDPRAEILVGGGRRLGCEALIGIGLRGAGAGLSSMP
ncbi:hypothetical protein ACSHXN_45475 (plasmid) [Streptomyces sp. HUAS TT11]|uniref:hypothetical protein n=1 Tax=Streptomyces sp. HUAS TT11 TaxID=3447508 RepID=UPI003F6551F0